jgi:glycosyltransferase involved in cell wall biosynthesis
LATGTSLSAPEQPESTNTVATAAVSVVIPAYNEQERITPTLDLLVAKAQPFRILEIIVVDDGSNDRTAELVTAKASETALSIRLIQLPHNRGKGAALRAGVATAVGDYVASVDADLSATPSAIPRALDIIAIGADVVIGTRISPEGVDFRRTQPRIRQISGHIFVLLRRLIVGLPYADTQCPFKIFTNEAAQLVYPDVQTDGWSFDVELLARARKHKLTIVELPILWGHVGGSQLHIGPRTALAVIRDLIAIRARAGGT